MRHIVPILFVATFAFLTIAAQPPMPPAPAGISILPGFEKVIATGTLLIPPFHTPFPRDRFLVALADGSLTCFSPAGEKLWNIPAPVKGAPEILGSIGTAAMIAGADQIATVNWKTGETTLKTLRETPDSPVALRDNLLLAQHGKTLDARDPALGTILWSTELPDRMSDAHISNDRLLIQCGDTPSTLLCLNLKTGKTLTTLTLPEIPVWSDTLGNGNHHRAEREKISAYPEGQPTAKWALDIKPIEVPAFLNGINGSRPPPPTALPAIVVKDTILCPQTDGLHFLNADGTEAIIQRPIHLRTCAHRMLYEDRLYFFGGNGGPQVIDVGKQSIAWIGGSPRWSRHNPRCRYSKTI